jgi:hypothetical protein
MEIHLKNEESYDISKDIITSTIMNRYSEKIQELQNSGRISPTTCKTDETCRFWLRGKCTKGLSCRWKHSKFPRYVNKSHLSSSSTSVHSSKSSSKTSSRTSDVQEPNDLEDFETLLDTPCIVINGKWADVADDEEF